MIQPLCLVCGPQLDRVASPQARIRGRARSAEFRKVSERLWGGNGDDHFTLNALLTGSVSGLSQIVGDSLDGSDSTRAVTLLGSAGLDSLVGGMFDDSLDGGDGKDTLAGQTGDEDRLFDATAAEIMA